MKDVPRKTGDAIGDLIAKLRANTDEMRDVIEKFRRSKRIAKWKRRGRPQ
jgi:hypothetical protein